MYLLQDGLLLIVARPDEKLPTHTDNFFSLKLVSTLYY